MKHFTTEDRVCDVYNPEGKLRTNHVGPGTCGDLITRSQSLPKDMFGGTSPAIFNMQREHGRFSWPGVRVQRTEGV